MNIFGKPGLEKYGAFVWGVFHAALLAVFAVCFLAGQRFRISTALFDILPQSSAQSVGNADRILSDKNGRAFFVLAEASDFETAKLGASLLYGELLAVDAGAEENGNDGEKIFEYISLGTSTDDLNEIIEFYFRNRFLLLDKSTVGRIEADADEFADDALEKAYGGFSLMPIDYMDSDPFFLTDFALENLIDRLVNSGTAMSLVDGVLSAEYEGKFYVMLRGSLTPLGAAITNKKSGVKKMYECAEKVLSATKDLSVADFRDLNFIYSGVPFHSYKSSSSAQREIAIITTISIIAIILLFVLIFKSVFPIVVSVAAIGLSVATALALTLLVFGEIHILCFVFGTTLIGTCLDYSVHFFVRWKSEDKKQSGLEIKKSLFKGLALSFASTEVCYLILLFAPFLLLKQIAVFSFAGILSSYMTVVLLYPVIGAGNKNRSMTERLERIFETGRHSKSKNIKYHHKWYFKLMLTRKFALGVFCIAALVSIGIAHRKNLKIDNDLRTFYTMSGKILDDEILSAKVLNYGASGWYFIVRGASQEEVLLNEELFCEKLNEQIAAGNLVSYMACTQFVPSAISQNASYDAAAALINSPRLVRQFLDLGYAQDEATELAANVRAEYAAVEGFVRIASVAPMGAAGEGAEIEASGMGGVANSRTPNASEAPTVQEAPASAPTNTLPAFERQALSALWIGESGGEWFSAIIPLHATDDATFRQLAAQDENVFFVNMAQDVRTELNRLTKIMLVLLGAAFLVLILSLNLFYPVRTVLKIAVMPIVILLTEWAVLSALNIPLGFFSVTGIILVFGLGLDYIIYSVESAEPSNSLAIFISFLTTELSFGAIALSSFAPVHIFGTVVFVGLLAAWVCQLFLRR